MSRRGRAGRCAGPLPKPDCAGGLIVPVPILLVTGFLGAGKTTVVNHLLAHAQGRRIAALVNDFGAINIYAELITGASDGVVNLSNGCICCSLQGDLLRTLATLLRRDPRPEFIVIETSGVADPADIVRNLMDPVIWREAPLETVLCVVDATTRPAALNDALLSSQVRAADVVALSKVDLVDATARAQLRDAIRALRPAAVVVDALHGEVSAALLFPADLDRVPAPREPGPRRPAVDRFETLSWTSERPVSLPRLHRAGCLRPACRRRGSYSLPRSGLSRAPRSTGPWKGASKLGEVSGGQSVCRAVVCNLDVDRLSRHPENGQCPVQSACPKSATSGCSRLAQSWSDLLSRADVFDGLGVILVRAMSGRPHSGNALPPHLRDRHQHTFVYLFHPFSCPVLTLVQLSDGERFLYSRRLQRGAQAAHNLSLRKRD